MHAARPLTSRLAPVCAHAAGPAGDREPARKWSARPLSGLACSCETASCAARPGSTWTPSRGSATACVALVEWIGRRGAGTTATRERRVRISAWSQTQRAQGRTAQDDALDESVSVRDYRDGAAPRSGAPFPAGVRTWVSALRPCPRAACGRYLVTRGPPGRTQGTTATPERWSDTPQGTSVVLIQSGFPVRPLGTPARAWNVPSLTGASPRNR